MRVGWQSRVLYLPQDPHQELYTVLSYKRSGSALSVLLHFKVKDMLTEDIPLKFNTLMNKQTCFFDKNLSIELQFYNYSSVL